MKTLNMEVIRSFQPCYDPIRHLPEDWSGSVADFLCYEHIPAKDRLWVVVRKNVLTETQLKEFGLACARMVEHVYSQPEVKRCNDTTELFLDGRASVEQLHRAKHAAAAADAAAHAAAYAAYAADAADAAYAAAYAAYAADAAAYAAYAAAYAAYAAYAADAADAAAADAAYYAAYAAYAAAAADMREFQCSLLLHIIEAGL